MARPEEMALVIALYVLFFKTIEWNLHSSISVAFQHQHVWR
jgi:hypothetical protein